VTEAEGSGAKEKDDDNNNEKGIFGALRLFFCGNDILFSL
jgi:hypothetical protein